MASHWEVVRDKRVIVANTAEELWELACDYFKWCDENKIENTRTVTGGRGTNTIDESMHRPYTIKGLCIHCGITEEYLNDLRLTKDTTSLYYEVVSRILYIIHTQNVEMATVGLFNPMFTAKVLNMDKPQEGTPRPIRIEIVGNTPKLAESENEILENQFLESGDSGDDE